MYKRDEANERDVYEIECHLFLKWREGYKVVMFEW